MTLRSAELADLIKAALPTMLAPGSRDLSRRYDASVLALSGESAADLNMLFVGPEADPAGVLTHAAEEATRRSLPMLVVAVPETRKVLTPAAQALGFALAGEAPMMVLDLASSGAGAGPGPATVERVMTPSSIAAAAGLQAAGFGLAEPAMARLLKDSLVLADAPEVFLTHRDGKPISTVTLTRHGAISGVWSMATAPDQQGRGGGRALLEAVLTQQSAKGVSRAFLMATEAGLPLYRRLGFRTAFMCAVWARGSAAQGWT